jgi:hypothetical protein
MISNPMKITAVTGAALLSLGLAGPALAGTTSDPGKTGTHSGVHVAPTLAQVQAWLKAGLDRRIAWIDKVQAKIDASTVLTDAQKADWTAKLADKRAKLVALEAAVAAATTTDEVEAAIKASGLHLFGHGFGRHHDGRGPGCDAKSARKDPAGKQAATKHSATSTHSVTKPSRHIATFGHSTTFAHGTFGQGTGGHHQFGGSGRHGGNGSHHR